MSTTSSSEQNQPGYVTAKDGHTYHKSATANATVAPTNDATLLNAAKTKGLNSEQSEFVTLVDFHWGKSREVNKEFLMQEYDYSEEEFNELVKNPQVLSNLVDRGIPPQYVNPDALTETAAKRLELSPIQLVAANTMLDLTDTRSTKKRLQDLGITTYQYNAWLRDPKFSDYLRSRAEAYIGDVKHEALLALVDQVQSGNMKAIEFYMEFTGQYVREVNRPQPVQQQNTDLQAMIIRIVEIVVDEVHDPEVASRIADRLKGLVAGAQVAGVIPAAVGSSEVIEQPHIKPAREITPQVQAMIEKGLGVNT